MNKPLLHRTKEGRMLCIPHNTTGAPKFHTVGCDACNEARARGIIRPDASDFTHGQRKRIGWEGSQRGFIDWNKRKRTKAAIEKARTVTT